MLIINDTHFSFTRKGGTTPRSQEALRGFLYERVRVALSAADDHVLILGDIFDDFESSNRDLIDVLSMLQDCVLTQGRSLTLVAGNHDVSMRGSKVSSFEVLSTILSASHPGLTQVVGIDEVADVPGGVVVAHCSNQDVFDRRLASVLESVSDGQMVYLHANYSNPFAERSDHSLNVSEDVAKKFKAKGATLVFAHEHQARIALGGSVVVLGNQVPTSVADCLGNDGKFAHLVSPGNIISHVPTWTRGGFERGGFAEIDWRELGETSADFIRVVGEASSAEASEVINAISKYRTKSDAFVITNAVKIEGIREAEALPETFEATRAFDVMDFIGQHLEPAEMEVVKELLA